MPLVLGILGSGRRDGYTVKFLRKALSGASRVKGVEAKLIHLLDYKFGPCTSCYECIRREDHRCILKDDMGMTGEGRLWREVLKADGFILASPVHMWSADALMHLFMERLYPAFWSGELRGKPVAIITVASNQGFQHEALRDLTKWVFTHGLFYVDGLSIHAACMDEGLAKAEFIGERLAEEVVERADKGFKPLSEVEKWIHYVDKPWSVYEEYVKNLTYATGDLSKNLIKDSIAKGVFKRRDSRELILKALREFEKFSKCFHLNDVRGAIEALVKSTSYWTHATWKEFLEEKLIKAKVPKTYRPIEE